MELFVADIECEQCVYVFYGVMMAKLLQLYLWIWSSVEINFCDIWNDQVAETMYKRVVNILSRHKKEQEIKYGKAFICLSGLNLVWV